MKSTSSLGRWTIWCSLSLEVVSTQSWSVRLSCLCLVLVATVLSAVINAMEVAALKKLDIAHLNDNTYGKMMASLDQVIYMVRKLSGWVMCRVSIAWPIRPLRILVRRWRRFNSQIWSVCCSVSCFLFVPSTNLTIHSFGFLAIHPFIHLFAVFCSFHYYYYYFLVPQTHRIDPFTLALASLPGQNQ